MQSNLVGMAFQRILLLWGQANYITSALLILKEGKKINRSIEPRTTSYLIVICRQCQKNHDVAHPLRMFRAVPPDSARLSSKLCAILFVPSWCICGLLPAGDGDAIFAWLLVVGLFVLPKFDWTSPRTIPYTVWFTVYMEARFFFLGASLVNIEFLAFCLWRNRSPTVSYTTSTTFQACHGIHSRKRYKDTIIMFSASMLVCRTARW